MSQKFLVRYIAHVVEEKRPKDEDFPKVFFINDVYEVENDQHLAQLVNQRYKSLIEATGLTVFRNGGYDIMPNGTGNITKRIFLPWHMVSYFDSKIDMLVEQKPADDQTELLPTEDTIPEPQGSIQ